MFNKFEDRGSMEFVYEQKVGLMDVLKDNISNYYLGRTLSLIYTLSLHIETQLLARSLICLVAVLNYYASRSSSYGDPDAQL